MDSNFKLTPEQKLFFKEQGYLHLKNFFDLETIEKLREACMDNFAGDTLGREKFMDISLHPKIISCMRDIMDSEVIEYPGLSKVASPARPAQGGRRGYHDDALGVDVLKSNQMKRDFYDDSYLIINTAIYLQDHADYSHGLKIKPGSHRYPCIFAEKISTFLKNFLKAGPRGWYCLFFMKSVNVPTRAGDFIFWNLRTHHSGHAVRLKFAPEISLHPLIENFIPRFMKLGEGRPRCAVLTIYSKPGEYFERYFELQLMQVKNLQHWYHSRFGEKDLIEKAKALGVNLKVKGIEMARVFFQDRKL